MPNDKPAGMWKICPVCKTGFEQQRRWQKHDQPKCRKKAYDLRVAKKLRRLERLERGAS